MATEVAAVRIGRYQVRDGYRGHTAEVDFLWAPDTRMAFFRCDNGSTARLSSYPFDTVEDAAEYCSTNPGVQGWIIRKTA